MTLSYWPAMFHARFESSHVVVSVRQVVLGSEGEAEVSSLEAILGVLVCDGGGHEAGACLCGELEGVGCVGEGPVAGGVADAEAASEAVVVEGDVGGGIGVVDEQELCGGLVIAVGGDEGLLVDAACPGAGVESSAGAME